MANSNTPPEELHRIADELRARPVFAFEELNEMAGEFNQKAFSRKVDNYHRIVTGKERNI